jgi:histidinol dehydrogenase
MFINKLHKVDYYISTGKVFLHSVVNSEARPSVVQGVKQVLLLSIHNTGFG